MDYQVRLENFEGPLDLLLFLIRENEINIYDIPISLITRQYLGYLDLLQSLDLEVGSEFLLMATTLMRIKAKLLLPRRLVGGDEEEVEEEDPREALVRQLIEYQRFKQASFHLNQREHEQSQHFPRIPAEQEEGEKTMVPNEVGLWNLLAALKSLLERSTLAEAQTIERQPITIEEKMAEVLDNLTAQAETSFTELLSPHYSRLLVVVTLLAVLELIKLGRIVALQDEPFGEIWLRPIMDQPDPLSQTQVA